MSYRCGLDARVASMLNTDAGPPRITCDGCGARLVINPNRLPPKWFLDNKAPPGWKTSRLGDVRRDLCPKCKVNP